MMSPDGFSIGKLSELSGCPVETIRYYERAGVLQMPPRTLGGRRVYTNLHVQQLSFVRRARDLGFSLERIRRLLALRNQGAATRLEVRAVAAAHPGETRAKLAGLQGIVAQLSSIVDKGEAAGEALFSMLQEAPRQQRER